MTIIVPANTLAAGGFDVDNSCRFNDGDSAYMHLTPGSGGNRRTFTISMWVKRSEIASNNYLWGVNDGTNPYVQIVFNGNHKLYINDYDGSEDTQLITTQVFRDVSAWYHIVIAYDTTQSTAANRIKLYVNGTRVTAFDTETYPAEDFDTTWNNGVKQKLGAFDTNYFDGYMAEVVMIEGSQLAPTSFGEFDSDSGIWKPIDVSGLTFGTNGFYLDFKASGNLGNDANGGTDFTEVNLAAADQATDTCTNNFATANPLANLKGAATFAQGNLEIIGDNSANHNWQSTIGLSSGKWYWEMKSIASSPDTGLMFYDQSIITQNHAGEGFATSGRLKIINNSTTGSAIGSTAQNDIHGMALDLDNGKMFIHRNGTYLSSGDPANGTNPLITTAQGLETEGIIGGFVYDGTVQLNFGGCPAFAISSGNADGDGFGNFEYAPPSGFFALCTKNLAEYG